MPKSDKKLTLAKCDRNIGLLVTALEKLESRVGSDFDDQDEAIEGVRKLVHQLDKFMTELLARVQKLEQAPAIAETEIRLNNGKWVDAEYVERLDAARRDQTMQILELKHKNYQLAALLAGSEGERDNLKSQLRTARQGRWSLPEFFRKWTGPR